MKRSDGFTLVELAVVLAIISIVAAASIGIGTSALRAADKYAVQERLTIIKKALNQFAQMNGYLPCPADRQLAPSSGNFGIEARNAAAAYTVPASTCAYSGSASAVAGVARAGSGSYVFIGMVPVRTLGLPDSYASDPWADKITYAVSGDMIAQPGSYNKPLAAGSLIVRYGDTTTYQVASRAPAGSGTPGTGYAAFILISHGPSGVGAYATDGSSAIGTCGTTTIDSENCNDDNIFIDAKYNEGTQSAQFSDDYVVWDTNLKGITAPSTNYYSNAGSGGGPIGCSNVTSTTPFCQEWCAPCTTNLPASPASFTNPVLCSKVVNATSSSCQATCVWGGLITTGSKYQPCP